MPYTFEYQGVVERKTFLWTIVSRRSCYRAGTRLYRRGIDFSGNVANFVETEQIVEFDKMQSSFVQVSTWLPSFARMSCRPRLFNVVYIFFVHAQIRGSIPLYWTQFPNMKLKPPPVIVPNEQHTEACRKHLTEIIGEYGKIVIVNLVSIDDVPLFFSCLLCCRTISALGIWSSFLKIHIILCRGVNFSVPEEDRSRCPIRKCHSENFSSRFWRRALKNCTIFFNIVSRY